MCDWYMVFTGIGQLLLLWYCIQTIPVLDTAGKKTHTLHTTPCEILSDTQMVPSMSNVTMSIVAAPILTAEIPVGVGCIHG